MYILFKFTNSFSETATSFEEVETITNVQLIGVGIEAIVSIVVIVLTALLMKNNQKRVKGLGYLLASGITSLIFSFIGISIGIVIWILCGYSIKCLKQKNAEDNFETALQDELNVNEGAASSDQQVS